MHHGGRDGNMKDIHGQLSFEIYSDSRTVIVIY
ncbi:hypothetical protein EDF76_2530 [Raoultella terrigena]|nr:hypothetical protein EDF76_2530 [Raoultella terrigena]